MTYGLVRHSKFARKRSFTLNLLVLQRTVADHFVRRKSWGKALFVSWLLSLFVPVIIIFAFPHKVNNNAPEEFVTVLHLCALSRSYLKLQLPDSGIAVYSISFRYKTTHFVRYLIRLQSVRTAIVYPVTYKLSRGTFASYSCSRTTQAATSRRRE